MLCQCSFSLKRKNGFNCFVLYLIRLLYLCTKVEKNHLMKKILVILLSLVAFTSFSQELSEEAKRKFSFGIDVFTDIWQDLPKTIEPATINQGVDIFGSYNYIINDGNFSLSPGIGLSYHNLNNKSLTMTVDDSTIFYPVPDSINFRRTKFTLGYFDIPIELRYKSENDVRFAIGIKFGFLMTAFTKYKGDDYLPNDNNKLVIYKKARIPNVSKFRYGISMRLGYKWLNLWGYYQLSSVFDKGRGPEMYPISIGISLMPY